MVCPVLALRKGAKPDVDTAKSYRERRPGGVGQTRYIVPISQPPA
jgi:hypothetical protein